MKAVVAAAIALPLCACSVLPREGEPRAAEVIWQTANAYDYSQTINTARRPDCYAEYDPFITAWAGHHPSSGEVGLAWAFQSTLHLAVTDFIDRKASNEDSDAWRGVGMIWQALTLWDTARNIEHNKRIGLRPFGKADTCTGS